MTDRCNLRCRYCMPEAGVKKISHDEILSLEEILRVAEIFARLGIKKIRLTGGEPLLRKNLSSLIRGLKNLSGIEQVTLTTNGVLLKNFAPELIAAGLDGINLSLDTLDEKIFSGLTRRKLFAQVIDALKFLLDEKNFSAKINCVPLRGINDGEILRLASLAKDKPVDVR
ncbi:MAG: radical SAM protein, partial [Selenomonadaceae bacterium]|nr:radical SAM protein [Selenomonadaceae bacterium]